MRKKIKAWERLIGKLKDRASSVNLGSQEDHTDRERFELNEIREESCRNARKKYSIWEKKQICNVSYRVE